MNLDMKVAGIGSMAIIRMLTKIGARLAMLVLHKSELFSEEQLLVEKDEVNQRRIVKP